MRKTLFPGFSLILAVHGAYGQPRLQSLDPAAISREDQSALSSASRLNTLRCVASVQEPAIGLDLRFQTGFAVKVPLEMLGDSGGMIRTVLRVHPLRDPGRARAFRMDTVAPPIDPEEGGDVELSGQYAVGPGKYRADLLVAYNELVCVAHWKVEAELGKAFRNLNLPLDSGQIEELPVNPFSDPGDPPLRTGRPLRIKVLVNFAPAGGDATLLDEADVRAITAILRAVERENRFGRFGLVAFSSDQERVLLRHPESDRIDFRALGQAVQSIQTGTVNFRQVQDRSSTARFLTNFLTAELDFEEPGPDAIVVISPKVSLDERISERELLGRAKPPHCPLFLLTYNPRPIANPWQGVLARALKNAYRAVDRTISTPPDLAKALIHIRRSLAGEQ